MSTHIVIIGGGAGGLVLATKLGNTLGKRGQAKITLVDAEPTHLWKPRLHEVAAGVIDSHVDELAYAAHARQHHFHFVLGRLQNLDRQGQSVTLAAHMLDGDEIIPERTLQYDTLVLALGSQTNDFGTEGAREHCIFLDQRQAAEKLRREFLNTYLKASANETSGEHAFDIAIIGAGATGVELAAELDHAADALYLYGLDSIQPENVTITIIEAAERVMPALLPKASEAIEKQLRSMNIQVLCNERVTRVGADGVDTESGKHIPARLKVWSAGVKASPLLQQLDGLSTNRIHQIKVDTRLRSLDDSRIYALGDCAECIPAGAETALPPRAQVAAQQADYLARSLIREHRGKRSKDFVYKDKGSLVSLSKSGSVGQLMGNLSGDFTFEGKLARWFYIMLYRLHQRSLHGTFKMLLLMLRDRLNKRTNPTIKLH